MTRLTCTLAVLMAGSLIATGCVIKVEDGDDTGLTAATGGDGATGGDEGGDGATGGDDTGAGDFAACQGEHSGTYDGADDGIAQGTLTAGGELVITFTSSGGGQGVEGVMNITTAGDISGTSQGIEVSGVYDFGDCAAVGDWGPIDGPVTGSWELLRE